METGLIIKIFGLGCISIVTSLVLKKAGKEDIAFVADIVAILIVLMVAFVKLNDGIKTISAMFGVN